VTQSNWTLVIRQAGRLLRRRPAASVVVLLTLGLGMAATVSVFSVVEAFLLRPLGVSHIDRVVRVREILPAQDGPGATVSLSPATYALWRRAESPFESIAAATGGNVNLTGHGNPLRLRSALVSADFFDVLGIKPLLGRTFVEGEDQPGHDGEVVLGYGVWKRIFGGRLDVVGETISLNGVSRTVIGVLPRGYRHPYEGEVWMPLVLGDAVNRAGSYYLYAPARLRAGVSLLQAKQQLAALARRSKEAYPDLTQAVGADLTPLRREILGNVAPVLHLLLAGALLVLAAATLNVVNLIFAAGLRTARSASIRLALGARFRDLFLPSLVRYLLLVAAATAFGLPLIARGVKPLVGLSGVSAINEFATGVRLNGPTLVVALALVVLVGLVLAFFDAVVTRQRGMGGLWSASGRSASVSRRSRRGMQALVLTQFAAAFVLLVLGLAVAAGYYRLMHRDRGFDPAHVLTADIAFTGNDTRDAAARSRLVSTILDGLRRIPGIQAVGASSVTPDFPGTWGRGFQVEGVVAPDPPGYFVTNDRVVTPGYFTAMHMPLLRGRYLDDRDRAGSLRTVVVSRSFAERFWPGASPLGKRVRRWSGGVAGDWMTIVGVVGDVEEAAHYEGLDMRRAWYRPCAQGCDVPGVTFTLRGPDAPTDLVQRVRAVVHEADPGIAVYRAISMRRRLAETFDRELFAAILLGLFAFAGVMITVAGIYAVASISVAARFKDIGIRVALGAHPRAIAGSLLAENLRLFVIGMVFASPLVWLGRRWLRGGILEFGGIHPVHLAVASFALLLVGCVALIAPIRFILRVDPTRVLNAE
jgi:putative ABC transport system permease protein